MERNVESGFYVELLKLQESDPRVIWYQRELIRLFGKQQEIRARRDAECDLVEVQVKLIRERMKNRRAIVASKFINARRKELGVKRVEPIKKIAR